MQNKKIGIVSLGCPKNRVDSEIALGELVSKGYEITKNEEEAELIIVNTCGFIDKAKEESIETIIEMAGHKKTGACKKLVVMGCLAQRYKDELLLEIPEIDHLVGAGDFESISELVDLLHPKRDFVRSPEFHYSERSNRILTTLPHSAYLKISEGCSNRCSFCIIPKIRGELKSIPLNQILREAERLAESGVMEINLIAQDTTMYGVDIGMKKRGLSILLQELIKIDKIKWIRLLYCYPTFLTTELLELMAASDKICRYIDLPLQHCCDDILKLMLREESEKEIRNIISTIRTIVPDAAIRTAFITGFPGEENRHYEALIRFVQEMRFEHLGVFTYSNEEGTVAAKLPNQIPEEIKIQRREGIMELQKKISRSLNKKREGTIHEALIEGFTSSEDLLITARTMFQAPETDGVVFIEKSEVIPGEIVKVRITKAMEYDLVGEVIR